MARVQAQPGSVLRHLHVLSLPCVPPVPQVFPSCTPPGLQLYPNPAPTVRAAPIKAYHPRRCVPALAT